MPVDEAEEAEEPSSSRLSLREPIGLISGASGGSLAIFNLAKDFWSSLIRWKWGLAVPWSQEDRSTAAMTAAVGQSQYS